MIYMTFWKDFRTTKFHLLEKSMAICLWYVSHLIFLFEFESTHLEFLHYVHLVNTHGFFFPPV